MADNTYMNYQGRGIVDWAGGLDKITTALQGAESQQNERRAANEKMLTDNQALIDSYEMGKSKSLNNMTLEAASKIKSSMLQWNKDLKAGKISAKEYRMLMQNVQTSWGNFATTAKTMEQKYSDVLARQQVGEKGEPPVGSSLEVFGFQEVADLTNLKNKNLHLDEKTGNVLLGEYDDNGNLKSFSDFRVINNPANIAIDRVNVDELTTGSVEEIGSWITDSGYTSIEDARKNPAFNEWKNGVIYTIAPDSNPRAQASVLMDNGAGDKYFYASNEKHYEAKAKESLAKKGIYNPTQDQIKSEMDAVSKYAIRVKTDENGNIMPELTDEQKADARNIVDKNIEMKIAHKVDRDVPSYSGGGRSSGDGNDKEDKVAINSYIASVNAITEGRFDGFDTDNYQFTHGVDKDKKNYVSVQRLKETSGKIGVDKVPLGKPVKVYSPDGMTQYLKNIKGNIPLYHKGKDDYRKLYGDYYYKGSENKIQSYSEKDLLNNGWSKDQIKQAVKLGKIKLT